MEKNRKRALRRHHVERIKAKRINYYGGYIRQLPEQVKLRHLGRVTHTAQLCSCRACGNPRRQWNEVTMQERRFEERTKVGRDEAKLFSQAKAAGTAQRQF